MTTTNPHPDTDHTAAADGIPTGEPAPLPWSPWNIDAQVILDADGRRVATVSGGVKHGKGNAALIVRAVNSGDDLLAAARAALERLEMGIDIPDKHDGKCFYRAIRDWPADKRSVARDCTCGLWQTREALRAAIEKASGDE